MDDKTNLIDMTAEIVSAYVGNNAIAASELPQLIQQVHGALDKVTVGGASVKPEDLKPAVPIKRSIQNDHLICLEDGKPFKSLKRHLMTHYNLTPEQYREKWGLPADYPMVAPSYAKKRSDLAKKMGLGQKGRGGGRTRRRK